LDRYHSSANIDETGILSHIEALEIYAPFIRKNTDLDHVKQAWWDVWSRRFEQEQLLKEMTVSELDETSWERIRKLKLDLVNGDETNG